MGKICRLYWVKVNIITYSTLLQTCSPAMAL